MPSKRIFAAFLLSSSLMQAQTEVFADLLVWWTSQYSTENWAQVFETTRNTTNVYLQSVDFGHDYGFRVGADYFTCHDGWDVAASYTWFRGTGRGSASTTGEIASGFLGNFYINNADGTGLGPSYHNASIFWKIQLNILEGELGRAFLPCDCLLLRPFIGLKGGWIDQTIESKWANPTNPALQFSQAKEDLENNFWGVGPSVGVNFDWNFWSCGCNGFSLFDDFSAALLYGNWSFKDHYENNQPTQVIADLPKIRGAAPSFRNFIGLSWKREAECYSFSVRLGYEAQVWLSQLQYYSLSLGRADHILTLQGGTLDVRFAF